MYYEERREDGVWYFRDTPTGEWRKKDVHAERVGLALYRNRIRGVAILDHETGLVVSMSRPARHHDILHKLADRGWPTPIGHSGYTQGFIDDRGYFLDREQAAMHVQLESGKKLFSEDLW